MSEPLLIPKLAPGQRSVVFAEVSTGILLTFEGKRNINSTVYYRVFNSEQEAIAFAREYVEQHPAVECSIRDEEGEHIMFLRKEH